MSWLIPKNELTPDQIRATELSPSENRIISGGPGSGKTQILLHRARYLLDLCGNKNNYKIMVYTNVLKDYIKSDINLLNLPEDNVLTFDHWCRLFYESYIGGKIPWNSKARQPNFSATRSAVYEYIDKNLTKPIYDFILVDEAQDLEEEVFNLLNKVAQHVTVCFDQKQQIYDTGTIEQDVLDALDIRKKNINLIEAFRVSQYLIVLASQFLPKGNERDFFLDQRRTAKMAKETPLLYYAENFDDEKEKLYEMVRERQLMNDRIAILFPQNRQVFGFAQGLREIGIEVEVPNKQNSKNNAHRTHDFTSNRPKLMSYHSAKGLTFDSVFLPRLVKRSFSWLSDENVEKLLFMAITRATKWAYFSTAEDNPLEILYKLESLEESGTIKLLRGTEDRRSKSTSSSKKDGDDLDFL